MSSFFARFSEPSTWAGLAALAQAAKSFAPSLAPLFDTITGLSGYMAMQMRDKGAPAP